MPASTVTARQSSSARWTPDTGSHRIESASGHMVDLCKPSPDTIELGDIAHHLARTNRFTGATRGRGINVAAHSLWVARYLEKAGHAPATRFQGLIHDAAEAYLGDIAMPLKTMPAIRLAYAPLEQHMMQVVRVALGLPPPTATQQDAIAHADALAASAESLAGLPSRGASPRYQRLDALARRLPVRLWHPLNISPAYAAHRYVRVFHQLARQIQRHPVTSGKPS